MNIYHVCCTECDFSRPAVPGALFVVLDDKSEAILPHPVASLEAERSTGKTYEQLSKEGRVRSRLTYLCLSCGEFGYYGEDDGQQIGIANADFEERFPQTDKSEEASPYKFIRFDRIRRTATMQCASCDKGPLEIAGKGTGGLIELIEMILGQQRWQRWKILRDRHSHCPVCRTGYLHWDIWGVS